MSTIHDNKFTSQLYVYTQRWNIMFNSLIVKASFNLKINELGLFYKVIIKLPSLTTCKL